MKPQEPTKSSMLAEKVSALNPDCTASGNVNVRVTKQSEHGTVGTFAAIAALQWWVATISALAVPRDHFSRHGRGDCRVSKFSSAAFPISFERGL
jgi:hypothetical protein